MTEARNWYIAIVAINKEKVSAEFLSRDYTVFLPSQKVVSVWKDGRRKVRDKILIPGKLFVYCTEEERIQTMKDNSLIQRYMVDVAGKRNQFGRRPVAIVPPDQVERLKFILGQGDAKVEIDNADLKAGEKVRVVRGAFHGLEGVVTNWTSSNTKLLIQVDYWGCASLEISLDDVERVK